MRLTLRTMLAYLDGILTPEDAQDIGKKIEDSAFAYDLMHRVRDLMRRIQLAAPGMESEGPGLDPNVVAEYLDNTLTPERVTDFEKVCLESDIHLGEVAACHQILTLVLGEMAEIDPETRQKMYDAPARALEVPYAFAKDLIMPIPIAGSPSMGIGGANQKHRFKPAVPEYLRDVQYKNRWIAVTAGVTTLICVLVLILFAFGQFEPGTPLGKMIPHAAETAAEKPAPTRPVRPTRPEASPAKTASETTRQPDARPAARPSNTTEESSVKKIPDTDQGTDSSKPSGPEITPTASLTLPNSQATQEGDKSTKDKVPQNSSAAEGAAGATEIAIISPNGSAPSAEPKEPGKDTTGAEKESAAESATVAASTVQPAETDGKTAKEQTKPTAQRLGQYKSDNQALLGNIDASDWRLLANKESLFSKQLLLTLPTYRTEISLDAGVNLQMLGGTALDLLPGEADQPSGVKIRYGRIVIMPLSNPGTRLQVVIGDRKGIMTFVDPDAIVAAEVRPIHALGENPETEPNGPTTDFFVTTGHVFWDEQGQKTIELTGPARFKLQAQLPAEILSGKEFPKWITGEPLNFQDRHASGMIIQTLQSSQQNRPVKLGLLELAEHRQKEVRWLAVRCLGYIGYFDPMVTVLDSSDYKQDWSDYIDQLHEALARDHETAAEVRKSLEKRYPPVASDLFRMLWGYSDKELANGEDAKLVKYLESDNLSVRVLSSWNLEEITGKRLAYRPENTLAKRQQPVIQWKQRLQHKEIRSKSAEEKTGSAKENPVPQTE